MQNWDNAIVTDVSLAMYVAPGTGRDIHKERPFHGLVLNDSAASKKIHFSDGTVLTADANEVFYLPKGLAYRVEHIVHGGCWAINFDLLGQWEEKPFSISVRNHEAVRTLFKEAADMWKIQSPTCNAFLRKSLYTLFIAITKEQRRGYMPGKTERLIRPALDAITRDFTKNDLSVRELAGLCRISEAYFRRIFKEKFSVSPKEYIISLRMEYAKKLLRSRQLPVTQVAELCGYPEPCHFSREFTRYTGTSPRSYTRQSTTDE